MSLHGTLHSLGFSEDEAEEILVRERQRIDLVQEEIQHQIWTGEREVTDGDSVQTMRDMQ